MGGCIQSLVSRVASRSMVLILAAILFGSSTHAATTDLLVVDRATSTIARFDGETGEFLTTFAFAKPGTVVAMLVHTSTGNLLLTDEKNDEILEFDGETGASVRVFASGPHLVNPFGMAIGPNGNLYVVNRGRNNGSVVELDAMTGVYIRTVVHPVGGWMFDLAFAPDGNLVVGHDLFGSSNQTIRVYDPATGDQLRTIALTPNTRVLAFGPNGNLFVSRLNPPMVLEIDFATGGVIRTFSSGLTSPHGFTFGPNGNLFVSDAKTGQVVEYDMVSGTSLGDFIPPSEVRAFGLLFHTDVSPPVSVAFDAKPGACPNPVRAGGRGVLPAAIMGDGTLDLTAIDPGSLRLNGVSPARIGFEDVGAPYDPRTGKESCGSCSTEGPDGEMDLVMRFDLPDILATLGPIEDGDCAIVDLTGELADGTAIVGEEVLLILDKGKKGKKR